MLPSQAFPRREPASRGSVCLADGAAPARDGERGAVIVHVAVALTGLLAFAALTIDLGTVWVARAQAQNAVDAAALAGAISLAYGDPSDADAAMAAARAVAHQHSIWGDPVSDATLQLSSGACPAGAPAASGDCVNIAVERGGGIGTPLPVFFAGLYGGGAARLRASASAKVMSGNTSGCPAAVAVPHRWTDLGTNPIDGDADHGPSNPVFDLGVDTYTAPGPGSPGTGYTRSAIGPPYFDWRRFGLNNPLEPLGQLEFMTLDFRPDGAGDPIVPYRASILGCSGVHLRIGDEVPIFFGGREEVREPFEAVFAMDDRADWDSGSDQIVNSAFPTSPRLITVAVFDPYDFVRQRNSGVAQPSVKIVNFMGVFVQAQTEHPLPGIVAPSKGSFDAAAVPQTLTSQASFLRSLALVR